MSPADCCEFAFAESGFFDEEGFKLGVPVPSFSGKTKLDKRLRHPGPDVGLGGRPASVPPPYDPPERLADRFCFGPGSVKR